MKHTTTIKSLLVATVVAVGVSAWAEPQKLGDSDVTWELSEDETVLTLGGTGPMPDYSGANLPPWNGKEITTAKIGSGVTSIGSYSFFRCMTLGGIPSALFRLGSGALSELRPTAARFRVARIVKISCTD